MCACCDAEDDELISEDGSGGKDGDHKVTEQCCCGALVECAVQPVLDTIDDDYDDKAENFVVR